MLSLSFVIPARNEQEHIGSTIDSIHAGTGRDVAAREIVLVDNSSTDSTARIGEEKMATVVVSAAATIGALRNLGASIANSDVIVFLDADVSLSTTWWESIPRTLAMLEADSLLLTGSHCSVPSDARSIYEKYWFSSFGNSRSSHLGSGHMIIRRDFFNNLGGFRSDLETGEDYDLCERVRAAGGRIEKDPRLVVYHHGFPDTALKFVRREIWHGRGDAVDIRTVLRSNVARAALMFSSLNLSIVISAIFGTTLSTAMCITAAACFVLLSSAVKFPHRGIKVTLVNAWIFYLYYTARTVAIIRSAGDLIKMPTR